MEKFLTVVLDIELLRPSVWLTAHDVRVGYFADVALDELNVAGPAFVTYVGPAPVLIEGGRCPVTGLVRHTSYDVIAVHVGEEPPLQLTRRHRLFSQTRDGWIAAEGLWLGEELKTKTGVAAVIGLDLDVRAPKQVFNLEVFDQHQYYVGQYQVVAHNSYGDLSGFGRLVRWEGKNVVAHLRKHRQHARETAAGLGVARPTSNAEQMQFIEQVVKNGETRIGAYGSNQNVIFSKWGNAVVLREFDGTYISNMDISKIAKYPALAKRWDEAVPIQWMAP